MIDLGRRWCVESRQFHVLDDADDLMPVGAYSDRLDALPDRVFTGEIPALERFINDRHGRGRRRVLLPERLRAFRHGA